MWKLYDIHFEFFMCRKNDEIQTKFLLSFKNIIAEKYIKICLPDQRSKYLLPEKDTYIFNRYNSAKPFHQQRDFIIVKVTDTL